MDEQKDGVSGVAVPDADLPKPEFSESLSDSSLSTLSADAIEGLLNSPALEEKINRLFKKTTDKRFSRLEKGEKTNLEVLAALKERGATIPEAVEQEYRLNDYINERVAQAVPQPKDGGTSEVVAKADGQFDSLKIVKELSLDSNEADVRTLLGGKYRNSDHFVAEAAKLALRKAVKPASSESSLPPLAGGVNQSTLSDADKNAKVEKLKTLYKTPTTAKAEIKSLEKELGWS